MPHHGRSGRHCSVDREDPRGMEQLIQSMQRQIQIFTKDLAKAHEQMTSKAPAATPTAAFAAPPSNAVAAAQPPPAASAPTSLPSPAATPLPPLATAQLPLYNPGRPPYFDYGEEGSYFRGQRQQPDRRPPRCFLCDEEGHFALSLPCPYHIAAPVETTGIGNCSRPTQGTSPRAPRPRR